MKLIEKYSTSYSTEDKIALSEVLSSIKKIEDKIFDFYISEHTDVCNHEYRRELGDVRGIIQELKESEEDKAFSLLDAISRNTLKGFVIFGVTAILTKFSKKTFEYINNRLDYKKYEKENKVLMSKYFKNKSEARHKEIERVLEMLQVFKTEFKITSNFYLFSKIDRILGYSLGKEYKSNKNIYLKNINIMLNLILDEKTYLSIKRYLHLPTLEEHNFKNIEKSIENINLNQYFQAKSKGTIYKTKEIFDVKHSIMYAALTESDIDGALISTNNCIDNSITYFLAEKGVSYDNDIFKITFSDSDFDLVKRGKLNISLFSADQYYAKKRHSNLSDSLRYMATDFKNYGVLKKWIRNYPTDFIGRVIEVECGHFRDSSACYAIVLELYHSKDKDKMFMRCAVADIVNNAFYCENIQLTDINKITTFDKTEALVFYQDLQHIQNMNMT